MNLIIVESPTKAKTIKKFLGPQYQVESSFGHIRDLPEHEMGIDIDHGFAPKYVIPEKAKKAVAVLKKAAANASAVILASDEDREGEAIAWHLAEALKLDPAKSQRIVFHEITKSAIQAALEHPRHIDFQLVDAQQARRILDRLVGYELSPFLWQKVARGLSAGRVQSVAVRFIVERERAIQAFIKEEYWTIRGLFATDKAVKIEAQLHKAKGKSLDKMFLKTETDVKDLTEKLKTLSYQITNVERKTTIKSPLPPFTTSTLQQAANRLLGFNAKQTMTLAQKLYELGHITYMRTDALNLSEKFTSEARDYLQSTLGKEYALSAPRHFKNKSKNAQEAHEAIRPTEAARTPDDLKEKFDPQQYRLYRLIWQRALATQMADARLDTTNIIIAGNENKDIYEFKASGQIISFPGYLKIYPEKTSEQELPDVIVGTLVDAEDISGQQHFTNPPARYSDAGLVKEMEKYGIGRPSTYAPTISTIIARNYVERDDDKRLAPTSIAFVVVDLLAANFSEIIDYKFTAELENSLDEIADGRKKWVPVISDFYETFHTNLLKKYNEIKKTDIMPTEKSEELCDKCGAPMIVKTGRYGKFLSCSGYPKCKNIKSLRTPKNIEVSPEANAKLEALKEKHKDEVCEKCGAPMTVKLGKYGPFLGCSAYPKCKTIKNIDEGPTVTCPVCKKGKIVKKFSRRGPFYACDNYPECKNAYSSQPTGENCPQCQALLLKYKEGSKCSNKECDYQA
jgi:DNA topoisomerase-1